MSNSKWENSFTRHIRHSGNIFQYVYFNDKETALHCHAT